MTYRVWQRDGSIDEIYNVKTVEYCVESEFYHFYGEGKILLSAFPKKDIKALGKKPD